MKEAPVHHEFPICKDKEVAMWESHGAKSKSTAQLVLRTQSGQSSRVLACCVHSASPVLMFHQSCEYPGTIWGWSSEGRVTHFNKSLGLWRKEGPQRTGGCRKTSSQICIDERHNSSTFTSSTHLGNSACL